MKFGFTGLILPLTLILVSSCSSEQLETTVESLSTVSGKINPFTSGGADSACTSVTVSLYRISPEGVLEFPALLETTAQKGLYSFNDAAFLGLTKNTTPSHYLIQASGCGKIYARPVTRGLEQEISYGSTLLAFSLGTESPTDLLDAIATGRGDQVEELATLLNSATDFNEAYQRLTTSTPEAERFNALFEFEATELATAAPLFKMADVSEDWSEGSSYRLLVTLFHWNSTYVVANEWHRESVQLSNSSDFLYSLGDNDQGEDVEFSLLVGADNGGGIVDTTKATVTLNFVRSILNNSAPIVPDVVLASAPLTRQATVYTLLDTGAALENCTTFTHLAITETPSPPSLGTFTAQNLTCTTAPEQVLSYELLDRTTGPKTIYFWTKDAADEISTTSKSISMTLNSSAPFLSITSPTEGSSQTGTITVTGSCEMPFDVVVGGTGITNPPPVIAACSGSNFSASVTLSAGAGNKSLSVSQTNDANIVTNAVRNVVQP